MYKLIFDVETRSCLGSVDGEWHGPGLVLNVDSLPADLSVVYLDAQGQLQQDAAKALAQAQAHRITQIKQEATTQISALDWKLQRAIEQEAAGWTTLAEADAVRAERESIRRSSNAAEDCVRALDSVAAVHAFTWTVDVQVPAPRRLTHKAFADRFSEEEFQSILDTVSANPSMRAWWEKFNLANDVNLDDPLTRAGLMALEMAGIVDEGRTDEVLA